MATIWIPNFKGGLDVRRLPESSPSGSLGRLQDGHINRGGEIEQRAAIVSSYALPAGATRGMAYAGAQLVVFAETTQPAGIPVGVIYQQLVHPVTASLRLAKILSWEYFAGGLYVIARFEDGGIYHYYNGANVTEWADKRSRGSVVFTNGLADGVVTSIKVNGIEILGATVAWTGDAASMGKAVANQIDAYLSTPEYVAAQFKGTVAISASPAGTTANGYTLVVAAADVSFTNTATLTGGISNTTQYQSGTYCRTGNQKLFVLSGGDAHFSALNDPTKWFSTDAGGTGAGFVTMSNTADNSDTLIALAPYLNYFAFFSAQTVQIWYMDPDPSLNKQIQVLSNTGTQCPGSVLQYGDTDVFYLDQSGERSLKARATTNAAAPADIGVPIDKLLIANLAAITNDQFNDVFSVIEPSSSRLWVVIEDIVYVYSAFTENGISAWSTYSLPANVVALLVKPTDRTVYMRAGDVIYSYGGQKRAPTYDNTPVYVDLPFLDGEAPSTQKDLSGVDVACRGVWEVRARLNLDDLEASDVICRPNATTFDGPAIGGVGQFSHISLRLESMAQPPDGGPAILSSAGIHYTGEPASDK